MSEVQKNTPEAAKYSSNLDSEKGLDVTLGKQEVKISIEEAKTVFEEAIKPTWGTLDNFLATDLQDYGKESKRDHFKPLNDSMRLFAAQQVQGTPLASEIMVGESTLDGSIKDLVTIVMGQLKTDYEMRVTTERARQAVQGKA